MVKHSTIDSSGHGHGGVAAIGLTSIVLFTAHAYRFGGGAFFIAYFVSMFAIGLPLLLLNVGAGGATPSANGGRDAGLVGVFAAWVTRICLFVVMAYFAVITSWSVRALAVAFLPGADSGAGTGTASLLHSHSLTGSHGGIPALLVVWILAGLGLFGFRHAGRRGAGLSGLLWVAVTLIAVGAMGRPGGLDGLHHLTRPTLAMLMSGAVWQAAVAQSFFTVALTGGLVRATRPRSSAADTAPLVLATLHHVAFEAAAAIAVFALLHAFVVAPEGSTLLLPFVALQNAAAVLPAALRGAGLILVVLLGCAGLRSIRDIAIMLARSIAADLCVSRVRAGAWIVAGGLIASVLLALAADGPARGNAGATVDRMLFDIAHDWVFRGGLLLAGLANCIALAWAHGATRIRERLNTIGPFHSGPAYDRWLRWAVPGVLLACLGVSFRPGHGGPLRAETTPALLVCAMIAAALLSALQSIRARPCIAHQHRNCDPHPTSGEPVARRRRTRRWAGGLRTGVVTMLLTAVLQPARASAQIAIDRDVIRSGDFVEINPPLGSDSLYATHRPGTAFATTAAFPTRGGPFVWEVKEPGIYLLTADDGTERHVIVRFRHAPLAGIFVMGTAVALLLTAAIATVVLDRRRSAQT